MALFVGNDEIKQITVGPSDVIKKVYYGKTLVWRKQSTFTINPTPSNATVTLTAQGFTQTGNSITVLYGTTVNWSVSLADYATQSGSILINDDDSMNIVLKASTSSNTPATKSLYLVPGVYEIYVVGGGGGSCGCGGGGSGSSSGNTANPIGGS